MAKKISNEERIIQYFMKEPPAECALMQKTITHILANRNDVVPPEKKARKKRAPKNEQPALTAQGDTNG